METPLTTQQTQVPEPKPSAEMATRPPLPPFTRETAIQKVRLAEDGWNSRDPEKVALAYTIDSALEKSRGVSQRAAGDHPFSETKVGKRAGLPADQRALGLRRKSHCGAVRL